MATALRIGIIGAGISGLAAAKAFRARGHDVTVVERSSDIGGVWEPSRSYPDVKTQTPRDLYAFSDQPMPKDYPEWPSGPQVFAYLRGYAERHALLPSIRFGQSVTGLSRSQSRRRGWEMATRAADGTSTAEHFDFVAICTGQFSQPNKPRHPGAEAFEAAGGAILHSSEHNQADSVAGKRVVVLGFSKSATDVAVSAVASGAASVTIVYREPTWKIPYFFGGLINFKNILYCRASEAMFLTFDASALRKALHSVSYPMIWANWRALEALLTIQFRLKANGLLPKTRIEDTIHCNLAVETPGFYKLVSQGRIKALQGTIARYDAGRAVLTGGQELEADLVVLATGWQQDTPFLDEASRTKLVEPDGQHRLYRMLVNPDLPDLGFVGFNSSFATSLSAELGANWLVRYVDGQLARQPTRVQMEQEIARSLAWRRNERPSALNYGGLCIAPYHNAHFDTLLRDMGAGTRGRNPLAATFAPLDPSVYAKLLAEAPAYDLPSRVADRSLGVQAA